MGTGWRGVAGAPRRRGFSGFGSGGHGQRPVLPAARARCSEAPFPSRGAQKYPIAVQRGPTGEQGPDVYGHGRLPAWAPEINTVPIVALADGAGNACGPRDWIDADASPVNPLPRSDCPASSSRRPFPRRPGAVAGTAPPAWSCTCPGARSCTARRPDHHILNRTTADHERRQPC